MDAHGPPPLPDSGRVLDPLWSWEAPEQGSVALLGEYSGTSMQRQFAEGDAVFVEDTVADVFALNVSGAWAPTRRLALAAVAPVIASAGGEVSAGGPALGDVRLWAPLSVVNGDDLHVDVIPSVGLPTGSVARNLGAGTVTGELSANVGWRPGPFGAWASVGARREPDGVAASAARATASAALGWSPSRSFGALIEARVAASLTAPGSSARQVPGEVLLSARGEVGKHAFYAAGVSRAVLAGVGAAEVRVYAGGGLRVGKPADPLVEPVVTDVPVPQPVQAVTVVDVHDVPVRGALVTADGLPRGTTDAYGTVTLDALVAPGTPLTVLRDGFETLALIVDGTDARPRLVMVRPPVRTRLRVAGQDGHPLSTAEIVFPGLAAPPENTSKDVGTYDFLLSEGDYTLTVRAPGFGTQSRDVHVAAGRTEALTIDAVLEPAAADPESLAISVVAPNGLPVEGAYVEVDGVALGSLSSGGTLVVEGLTKRAHEVTITDESHAPLRVSGATVAVKARLDWAPGTVLVVARSSGQNVPDAVVAFDGPTRLPPVTLGPEGQRTFQLRDGRWTAFVSSVALGAQQRAFEVREGGDTTTLTVDLLPAEGGDADLDVQVLDGDGGAIANAEVLLDGASVGRTSNTGSLALADLTPGARHLRVAALDHAPFEREIQVVAGHNQAELLLGYAAGTVQVEVAGPDGAPTNARIAWRGPAAVPPEDTGPDGLARFVLSTGSWTALVSNPDYGAQTRTVAVSDQASALLRVQATLQPPDADDATLAVHIQDPQGAPVADADVTVDGEPFGATGSGGDLGVTGLGAGKHVVRAVAPGFDAGTLSVVAKAGASQDARLTLPWGPGAVRVSVVADGDPPRDVTLGVAGPRVLAPRSLGPTSSRLFDLGPGQWWILASADGYAPSQTRVDVPPTRSLTEVTIKLLPSDPERAVVVLRVVDTDGAPVPDAAVIVDGAPVGATSPSGVVVVEHAPGKAQIEVVPSPEWRGVVADLTLVSGAGDRVLMLDWRTFPVDFTVLGPAGDAADAQVLLQGPDETPVVRVGADGSERVELRAGRWDAFASQPGIGVTHVQFDVVADRPSVVELRLVAPKTAVEVTKTAVTIQEQIRFDLDQATLRPDALGILDDVAGVIRANPNLGRIEVQGHTDDTGTVAHNLELSQQRAEVVRAALIARGVAPERLTARGYGTLRPLVDGRDDAARTANRRVQFVASDGGGDDPR